MFVDILGQLIGCINKMRVFYGIKSNRTLQLRVKNWSMIASEQIILDYSTFEGKTFPLLISSGQLMEL